MSSDGCMMNKTDIRLVVYVSSLSCVIKLCLQRANKNISTILYFCTTKGKERLGGNPQIFLLKQLSKTEHFIQLKYQCRTPTGCLSSRRRNPH